MSHYATPALERLWVEEVLHLHALWRQGPPRRPNPNPSPSLSLSLRPANRPAFKKDGDNKNTKKKRGKKKNKKQKQPQPSDPPATAAAAENEWPCPPAPPQNPEPAGWNDPAPAPSTAAPRPPPSADDQARAAALRAHRTALRACEEFFSSKKDGSSSDDDNGDEEDDDAMDEDGGFDSVVFKFFLGLFEKDGDLRGYYEKNSEKGEFCCLVCGGIGAKKGRRFPNCVGLVQHANAISKTKRRGAHRALAKAVCRVLGWDINRLPSIVLDLAEPLGKSLAKAADPQKEDSSVQKEENPKKVADDEDSDDEDSMECVEPSHIEASPKEVLQEDDALDEKEELQKEVAEAEMVNSGDQMNCVEIKEVAEAEMVNSGDQMNCIEIKEITDLPNKDIAIDEKEQLLKEVGESVESLDTDNGKLT